MGLLGGLLGGSSSKSVSTSNVTANVSTEITNVIDTDAIGKGLERGLAATAEADKVNASTLAGALSKLSDSLNVNSQVEAAIGQAQLEQNATLSQKTWNNIQRLATIASVITGGWFIYKRVF